MFFAIGAGIGLATLLITLAVKLGKNVFTLAWKACRCLFRLVRTIMLKIYDLFDWLSMQPIRAVVYIIDRIEIARGNKIRKGAV